MPPPPLGHVASFSPFREVGKATVGASLLADPGKNGALPGGAAGQGRSRQDQQVGGGGAPVRAYPRARFPPIEWPMRTTGVPCSRAHSMCPSI